MKSGQYIGEEPECRKGNQLRGRCSNSGVRRWCERGGSGRDGEKTLVHELFGKSSAQFLATGGERHDREGKAGGEADPKIPGLDM